MSCRIWMRVLSVVCPFMEREVEQQAGAQTAEDIRTAV